MYPLLVGLTLPAFRPEIDALASANHGNRVPYPDAFPRPAIYRRLCLSSGLHQFIAGASRLGDLYRFRLVPCHSFVRRS